MENPCHGCKIKKKCIEYDKIYLKPVMLSKGDEPLESPPKKKRRPAKAKKTKKQTRVAPSGPCKMGLCDRGAKVKGYCAACYQLTRWYVNHGRPVPTKLSDAQLKLRGAAK